MKIQRIAAVALSGLALTAVADAATSPADLAEPAPHPALPTESTPATLDALLNPRSTSRGDASPLRIQMITDAARTVGFRGGVASRAAAIRASLEKRGPDLDGLFNFAPLIMPSGALPPVIVEAQDVASFGSQQYRIASKVYRIERGERFVSVPPTWRDYLYTGLPTNPNVTLPIAEAQPKTSAENEAWQRAVRTGWQDGLAHADAIVRANFSRMTRDYNGMLTYSTLLQKGMISQTRVAETQRAVTGNANEIMIGDTTRQLTAPAQLQPDANRWTPAVSYAPGYRLSAPTPPAAPAGNVQAGTTPVAVSMPIAGAVALATWPSTSPASAGQPPATALSIAVPAAPPLASAAAPAGPLASTQSGSKDLPNSAAAEKSPTPQQEAAASHDKSPGADQAAVSTAPAPDSSSKDGLASTAASTEPAVPPEPALTWEGHQGDTLREVVTRWAATSNPSWHVDWATDLDYPIILDFNLRADNFLDATARVFAPYLKAKRRFTLSQQPEQRVLIVEEE